MRWQPTEGTVVRLGFNEESNFPSEENALIELDDLSEETDEDYVLEDGGVDIHEDYIDTQNDEFGTQVEASDGNIFGWKFFCKRLL